MPPKLEQNIREFHRDAIKRARRIGLSAYILNEDGSVLRVFPDGTREFVAFSAIAARGANQRHTETALQ